MKILQINKYFYQKGGSETVFFDTIDILRKKGHTVIPFSTKNIKNREDGNGYFIDYPELSASGFWKKLKYSLYFFYNFQAKRNLEQLIINEKPDIAHIHLLFNGLSISVLPVLKKHNIPTVYTAHDYRLICPSYRLLDKNIHICEKCKTGSYYHCITKRCSKGNFVESLFLSLDMYLRKYFFPIEKYVSRIICVSNFSAAKHREFKPGWASLIQRVYNPISPSCETGIKRGDYLLYMGRISHEKGIVTLLKAAAALPDAAIKIAGAGDYMKELNNIPENVTFVGKKNREELAELIKNASYVIVPSEWYETFGLVVVESFAHATPVIASDTGGISELVDNGSDGFLFRAGNLSGLTAAIKKALSTGSSEYLKMCENALQKSKTFAPEIYCRQLMEIYDELTGNS